MPTTGLFGRREEEEKEEKRRRRRRRRGREEEEEEGEKALGELILVDCLRRTEWE